MNNHDHTNDTVRTPVVTYSSVPLDDAPAAPVGYDTLPEQTDITVVDIQFKKGGRVYFFDPGGLSVSAGDEVILDTARGPEYGFCVRGNHAVGPHQLFSPLRSILRKATEGDRQTREYYKQREASALQTCQHKILDHGLEMKLVSAEYSFDGSKLLFYFTAEGRVDFRDLVKDLASVFRTRIELRQIGVRDETKLLGGLGICGRPFCCGQFLNDFLPVSIKMAKTQNLSLNPAKISGACGRLMCCLNYEQEAYEHLIKTSPRQDSLVNTCDGVGTVTESNLLRQSVQVRLNDDPASVKCYQNCDICVLRNGKARKNDPPIPTDIPPLPRPERRVEEPEDIAMFDESILSNYMADSAPGEEHPSGDKKRPARSDRENRSGRGAQSKSRDRQRKKPRGPKAGGGIKTAPAPGGEIKTMPKPSSDDGGRPRKQGGSRQSGRRKYYRGKKKQSPQQ